MPLKRDDLGLIDALFGLVEDMSSGEVYLVKQVREQTNPFTPPVISFSVVWSGAAMSIDQLSAESTRRLFGQTDDSFYTAAIATPSAFETIIPGLYGIINVSDKLQVVKGVVDRVDHQLSGVSNLYINSSEQIPAAAFTVTGL